MVVGPYFKLPDSVFLRIKFFVSKPLGTLYFNVVMNFLDKFTKSEFLLMSLAVQVVTQYIAVQILETNFNRCIEELRFYPAHVNIDEIELMNIGGSPSSHEEITHIEVQSLQSL